MTDKDLLQQSLGNSRIAFTSFNLHYLPQALLLLESLRIHEPHWMVAAVLVDRFPADPTAYAALDAFDLVVTARNIRGHDYRSWVSQYNIVEASTAVKPWAAKYLLEEFGRPVVYLDPDVYVYSPLDATLASHPSSPIMLTPHVLQPSVGRQSWRAGEYEAGKHGVFNLGFFAMGDLGLSTPLLEWWISRMEFDCLEDPCNGLYTDQKLFDFAPIFFPELSIVRDPGFNVASWNLHERQVVLDTDSRPFIGEAPLKFFHYTKVGSLGLTAILDADSTNTSVISLATDYSNRLAEMKSQLPSPPWAYARLTGNDVAMRRARRDSRLGSRGGE